MFIIDKEIDLIENNIDLFTDLAMLGECLTFIYDKNGRPDAMGGKHDDILFSDMIANEIRPQHTFNVKEKPPEQLKGWWTRDELEDKGYSPWEIDQIMLDMKSWRG